MFYSEDIIEQVRTENDIVEVIGDYVKLQKKGSSYFGLCPFHNEKSPSFSVSPNKQMYYCFGCGEGGNVISFLMKYENYTFIEAMEVLANRAGVELPKMEYSKEQRREKDLKTKIIEINTEAAKYFHYLLKSDRGKLAYNYLKGRQLSDEIIVKFGLGYSDKYSNNLYMYLKKKGYNDNELRETGLFTYDEKRGVTDKFWNRVMFPIMDANNRVIAFGGRVMGDAKPKYLNSPETKVFDKSRNLYGLNVARSSRKDYFLICEGYMDVISLHQAGFNNAVAALGTAFTQRHATLIKRYVKEVVLTFDSDEAGIKAALRAIPYLRDAGLAIKVLNMKPYKDPDEFIKALGRDAYEERIKNATNFFIFQVEQEQKKYNLNDPQEKTAFHKQVAEMLLEFKDEIERDNYLDSVCSIFKIPKEGLSKLVKKIGLTYVGKEEKVEKEPAVSKQTKKEDAPISAQRILLAYLLDKNNWFMKVAQVISPKDFVDPFYNKVASLFWEQMESGQGKPAQIMNYFEDEEEHKKVAQLFVSPIRANLSLDEQERAINDAVHKIKKESLDYRARNATDISDLQNIIKEQSMLQKIHITLS
ncbi:DNA primase [Eubacterium sp. Marseille-QA0814]|uniref:DNA primase n=1 Tax=Eubacterium sp. Marseille-QA0814 TaxID=3378778 RepID=UPI003D0CDF11